MGDCFSTSADKVITHCLLLEKMKKKKNQFQHVKGFSGCHFYMDSLINYIMALCYYLFGTNCFFFSVTFLLISNKKVIQILLSLVL